MIHDYKYDMLSMTHEIYGLLYSEFNNLWIEREITDFMKFNSMLEEFFNNFAIDIIKRSDIFNKSFY